MNLVRWLAALLIVVLAADASAGERPTGEELLTAYEKSVEKLSRVRIEWSRPETAVKPDEKRTSNGTVTSIGKTERSFPVGESRLGSTHPLCRGGVRTNWS